MDVIVAKRPRGPYVSTKSVCVLSFRCGSHDRASVAKPCGTWRWRGAAETSLTIYCVEQVKLLAALTSPEPL
jgi:hypothetical protein